MAAMAIGVIPSSLDSLFSTPNDKKGPTKHKCLMAKGTSPKVTHSLKPSIPKQHQAKRTTRLATLVIREPSAATLQGRRHHGTRSTSAVPAHRPGWTVPLFSFGDAAPLPWTTSMDSTFMVDFTFMVHRASSFVGCGNPSRPNVWAEEDQDDYKRRVSTPVPRVRILVGS